MFSFVWHFFIPLVIFVFVYWKILAVIRRQRRIAADLRATTAIVPQSQAHGTDVILLFTLRQNRQSGAKSFSASTPVTFAISY